jgi:arginine deiminase
VYRYHPMFAGAGFVTCYGDDDANHLPASVEGGGARQPIVTSS